MLHICEFVCVCVSLLAYILSIFKKRSWCNGYCPMKSDR